MTKSKVHLTGVIPKQNALPLRLESSCFIFVSSPEAIKAKVS